MKVEPSVLVEVYRWSGRLCLLAVVPLGTTAWRRILLVGAGWLIGRRMLAPLVDAVTAREHAAQWRSLAWDLKHRLGPDRADTRSA